jgi:hypothetical protein
MLKGGFDAQSAIERPSALLRINSTLDPPLSVKLDRDKLPGFLFRGLDLLC